MKIDELTIKDNALQLIAKTANSLWDDLDDDGTADNYRIALLGRIEGITKMADRMVECLKISEEKEETP